MVHDTYFDKSSTLSIYPKVAKNIIITYLHTATSSRLDKMEEMVVE